MNYLIVGLGAALGGIFRYYISNICHQYFENIKFPFSTFMINFIGSFLVGIVFAVSSKHHINYKLFFGVGLCGGFTTFSTFSAEIVNLLQQDNFLIASVYSISSLILCVFGAFCGGKLFGSF